MRESFIALGSNIGNREKNIADALCLLRKIPGVRIGVVSSLIETVAIGRPNQPNYLNGVVKILTSLSPQQLLAHVHIIEKKLGRTRTVKNGPRTIDLDILIFGDKVINEPNLIIPHPRMLERDFIMKSLTEIEPKLTRQWISQKILHKQKKLLRE